MVRPSRKPLPRDLVGPLSDRLGPVAGLAAVLVIDDTATRREIWQLGSEAAGDPESQRGWRLRAQGPLRRQNTLVPPQLLVCRSFAEWVARVDAEGWRGVRFPE